jgi:hypothetical protein
VPYCAGVGKQAVHFLFDYMLYKLYYKHGDIYKKINDSWQLRIKGLANVNTLAEWGEVEGHSGVPLLCKIAQNMQVTAVRAPSAKYSRNNTNNLFRIIRR